MTQAGSKTTAAPELLPSNAEVMRGVLRDAEDTVAQLRRMVSRLERFTDHLDLLTLDDRRGPVGQGEAPGQ